MSQFEVSESSFTSPHSGLERKVSKLMSSTGSAHTFSEEEKEAFSEHINFCLSDDTVLARHLPLDPKTMDLFEKCADGLIMCKLINLAQFDAIDERSINKKENMNVYQKTENQNLVLNAAKAIGCQIINIGAQDLIEGRPILVLGLVWQVIKIQLLSQITLQNIPELVLLLKEGEDMNDFLKLQPEMILLRWLNYHLKKGGSSRVVNNFGSDLADSEVYSVVLNRLNPELCPLITDESLMARAAKAINNGRAIGAEVFLKPKDICDGNKKLNTSMVAQLFNTCHGLSMEEADTKVPEIDMSVLEIDDVGDSREERVFRMWINSLNIDGLYVNQLFAESQDGVNLLKVIDRVAQGMIKPKRMNLDPKSRFKKVENANYVVELGKQMGMSLVNVGGLDIVDGNKKLILAIIWQLMRRYTLQVLEDVALKEPGVSKVNEDEIVKWANAKVKGINKPHRMRNLKDQSLSNSIFFLDLISAIEPRAVDFDQVTRGESDEDKMLNAKYAISNARKVGACVFLVPEDIIEVNSKMLLTFTASLWKAQLDRRATTEASPIVEAARVASMRLEKMGTKISDILEAEGTK